MKKALVVLTAILAAGVLWAQEKSQGEAQSLMTQAMQVRTEPVVRVYQVNSDNRERILKTLRSVVGEANVTADAETNVVVAKTSRNLAPALDELVKRLDVASPKPENIELTFYVVQASKEPFADAGPVPPELQSALAQIKSTFAYQSYKLLDTLFARSRSGRRVDTNGRAPLSKDRAVLFDLSVEPSVLSDVKPPRIHLERLSFNVMGVDPTSVGLSADLDFNAGQKVVIGKTGVQGGQSALILVASGRIVD